MPNHEMSSFFTQFESFKIQCEFDEQNSIGKQAFRLVYL